ncbi:NCS2 family permease [Candidatus Micrarchaeota archaeon]|nr:NCS2 family permease [Candidatus Micrarchaeota archaeon]
MDKKTMTELIAGVTVFFTVSYILVVNPTILSVTGMPYEAVFVATALSAAIATILMGLYANRPFVLAAGMGLNAYFAYSVVLSMGMSWQLGLAAVFLSGLLIFLLSLTKIDLGAGIPESFKFALTGGLGLFLVFIGLQNAHIVAPSAATILTIGNLKANLALIAIAGFFITGLLMARKVNAALLIGIITVTLIAFVFGVSILPSGAVSLPQINDQIALKLDFSQVSNLKFISVVWSFFIIGLFDIIGTVNALSIEAGFVGKKGEVKGLEKTIRANSIGIMIGALLGVPTIVTYLESATGIAAGGRTGKTAIIAGLLFLLALFFLPLIKAIPIEATSAAIVITGLMMVLSIVRINQEDFTEALPALMTLVTIPFTFSIAHGIAIGSIFYVFLKLVSGKRKDISIAMYVIALFSVVDLVLFL